MSNVRRRTNPQTVVVEQTRHSGVLRGPAVVIRAAIKRVGCAHQYDAQQRVYKVSRRRIDDVMVAIELDGHFVQLRMPGWA